MVDQDEGVGLKYVPTSVNPPFGVMQGYIKRIWAIFEIDKIIQVHKGKLLVRFENLQDKMIVEKRGVYYFDSKPFLVKGWNLEMDLHTESIKTLLIWVQFPDLDGLERLSKIGSIIGIPIKIDRYTKDRTMIKYARLLIEVALEAPFPEYTEFFNKNDMLIR
ncbi:hypothetical protein Cgig2_015016 [Carnegiea gigantea]|uniref:DUF4283 domain-containing protein n=1 Tax=Carnegiea gigantea TaxID=171969 RepID=A0A9Q1JGA2_9CARY|nr:hypothetical protein Cgig2_030670 [Carnegiea gigantea]KAJ8421009.1 hypothetical protein Cgig2_015016 [Carnegiea gigantea]